MAQEAHVALLTRIYDGSGSIVGGSILDPAKNVIIDLAPEEVMEYWTREETPPANYEDTSAAMYAFEQGRVEEARDMLEALAQQTPRDQYILHNLGVVYAALGDKTQAREVLQLLRVGGPL